VTNASMPLIGFTGYARSGKDSAGQALLDVGWERRSFADRLREFLLALDPIVAWSCGAPVRVSDVIGDIGWERAKDSFPEIRSLLQRCGTDAGRKVLGEDVWVGATLRDLDPARAVVVTDVRFPNEARAIQAAGGLVVRITRPGVGPATAPDGSVHVSETSMDDFPVDAVIRNGSTLASLRMSVWDLANIDVETVRDAA
jgi:hypothetical protein